MPWCRSIFQPLQSLQCEGQPVFILRSKLQSPPFSADDQKYLEIAWLDPWLQENLTSANIVVRFRKEVSLLCISIAFSSHTLGPVVNSWSFSISSSDHLFLNGEPAVFTQVTNSPVSKSSIINLKDHRTTFRNQLLLPSCGSSCHEVLS